MNARKLLDASVRTKLVGLLVGTSFVALLLACGAFVYYDRVSYAEAKRGTLSVLVRSVAQSAFGPTAFQDADSSTIILKVLESEPSAQVGAIYTQEGTLLSSWKRKGSRVQLPTQLSKLDQASGYRGSMLRITQPIEGEQRVGTLHVAFSADDIRARTARFMQIAAGVLALAVLLALAIATLAQRVFTRPVGMLCAAARRVQLHQDFEVRVARLSNDELGQLTDAFNAMLAMIQVRDRELEKHREGLEGLVQERTRDLERRNQEVRLVLDNVDQGLLMVDRTGVPGVERSATFDRWFGAPEPGQTLGQVLARQATGFETQFAMQWEQLTDGFLPLELNLAQLPRELETSDGRFYQLAYRSVGGDAERFERLLVVVTDVTEHVEKARAEAQQAQLISLLQHISSDRGGFVNFFRETEATLTQLLSDEPRELTVVMRELHTLKGNFGLFGLKPLAELVHEIEDACLERGGPPDADDRQALREAWSVFADRARTFLGEDTRTLSVDRSALKQLLDAIEQKRPLAEITALATRLMHEPVEPKLARMGERARALADRLGKGPVEVDIQAAGVVAPSNRSWLWQVLPHVVANSVDHGLDPQDERAARGKQTPGKLRIAAIEHPSGLVVEIQDDGRGIDWDKVRARAQKLGLPATTHEELVAALFADGVSTREVASDVSGRGIGLAAVEAACHDHGAQIGVESEPGRGTTFRVVVSNSNAEAARSGAA